MRVATYPQGFMTWLGPVVPLIHLCHPDIIRSVVSASGTHRSQWWCGCGNLRMSSPDSHALSADPVVAPSFLLLSLSAFLLFHVLAIPIPVSSSSTVVISSSPPGPGILGTLGMPEDHKQGSVLEEPNLEELGPDKDPPTTCDQEWPLGGWGMAEWRSEISARAGREAFLEEETSQDQTRS